ncbi:MAG: META domain-containing protein [Gammaproteobacteria bacterium]|jgi:heat shock protein HslJ|nr:META domain-containing protein [Gammaproteobacteria bacterium]
MGRLVIALLLLAASACVAAARQIEGYYRFGHEVNTVCSGEPEACYWLVDTDAEIRQQLKQQVAGLAPYTPVCLELVAEISATRADGFGRDYDGSIRVREVLGRCAAEVVAMATQLEDLQHRRWELHRIDAVKLEDFARQLGYTDDIPPAKVPDLDFGEQGFVSGNTGCNQFQGQARVVDSQLILSQLATTAMLCDGFAGELEIQLQLLFRNPLVIARDGSALILRAADRELYYRLRDWVN